MPLLFCLAKHAALEAASARLEAGEHLFAFLDDLYLVCRPDRVGDVHTFRWRSCSPMPTSVSTKVWNRDGEEPEDCNALHAAASLVDPNAIVWRGDISLLPETKVWSFWARPLVNQRFLEKLAEKSAAHARLLDRIPTNRSQTSPTNPFSSACLYVFAGVAVHSTPLATSGRVCNFRDSWEEGIPAYERCGEGVPRAWSQGSHKCDGQGHGPMTEWTPGGWRLLLTVSRCMVEPNLQPHWCRHWRVTGQPSEEQTAQT